MTDTQARTPPGCLDAETLAAFLDGRLEAEARVRAEAHIAECEDCYEAFVETMRTTHTLAAIEERKPESSSSHPVKRGVLVLAAITLLAAAAVTLVVLPPQILTRWWHGSPRPTLAELVSAVDVDRPIEARLTGGFAWGPIPVVNRGGDTERETKPAVQIAGARLNQALDSDRSARALADYGTAQVVAGHLDKAIDSLREALALSGDLAYAWSDLAGAYLARSDRQGQSADIPLALEAADTARRLDHTMAEALFNRALALERLHLTTEAVAAWREYLSADAGSKWADEARQHLQRLGQVASHTGELDPQTLRETVCDDLLARWATAADGTVASAALTEAREASSRLLAIGSGDTFVADIIGTIDASTAATRAALIEGHAAYGRGRTAYQKDDLDHASVELARARASLRQASSPLAAAAALYEAVVVYRRGDLATARVRLAGLLVESEAHPYSSLTGRLHWMLGNVASRGGQYGEAEAEYQGALTAFAQAHEVSHHADALSLLASLHSLIGAGDAWEFWIRALAEGTPAPASRRKHALFLAASETARLSGWLQVARYFQDAALDVARAIEHTPDVADALLRRSLLLKTIGDLDGARRALEEARATIGHEASPSFGSFRAEIDLVAAQTTAASDAEAGLAAANRSLEYFNQVHDRMRAPLAHAALAALYRATNRPDDALGHLRSGLAILDAERTSIAREDLRASFGDDYRSLVDDYVQALIDHGEPDAAFLVHDNGMAKGLKDRIAGIDPAMSLGTLKSWMPADAVLVAFAVHEDRVIGWTVRREASSIHTVSIGSAQLTRLVEAFGHATSGPAVAARLRELLVDPFLTTADDGHPLVLVLDGPLHSLPFAALPGRARRFLIEEHPIVIAPSAAVLLRASARLDRHTERATDVLAIGNPPIDRRAFPHLPELFGAEREVREVAANYTRPTVLVNDRASRSATLAALPRTEVFHFGGHAVLNAAHPELSQLVMSDASASGLTAADIAGLTCPRLRLVVLAACESAAGPISRSEGPMNLARAFLQAGAGSVVASRWIVGDEASRALFAVFHASYARTGDAIGALREAQLSMLSSADLNLRQPEAWAGFVVIGGLAQGRLDNDVQRRPGR